MEAVLDWIVGAIRTIISFCFVIGFIATIHEYGHYIISRLCGVRVDEFSLGVGKSLYHRRVGDTDYHLRMIPVLAYVRPAGMDPEEEYEPGDEPGEASFQAKGFWAKQAILVGGSLFNFLGALAVLTGVFLVNGDQPSTILVGGVQPGSAAEIAGVETGDFFTHFDGVPIEDYEKGIGYINARAGVAIKVRVKRPLEAYTDDQWPLDSAKYRVEELSVTPLDRDGSGKGLMGIRVNGMFIPGGKARPIGFGAAFHKAGARVLEGIPQIFTGTLKILKQSFTKMSVPKEVGGPVQIVHMISKQSEHGIQNLLVFTAGLSVSIGVFNLLPIPALDGGRMLLLLFATVVGWIGALTRNEKLSDAGLVNWAEEWLNLAGFLFLITVMLLVTWKDIREIFFGEGKSPAKVEAPKDPGGTPAPTGTPAPESSP